MIKAIVVGGNGQLGRCLVAVVEKKSTAACTFLFFSSKEADITNYPQIEALLEKHQPEVVINAAAYTQVDLAEKEKDKAFLVNACAVENLAKCCAKHHAKLVHISTDYVFDGTKKEAYTEEDLENPINTYGASKFEGEQQIRKNLNAHFIIRTSWLYSNMGHNFYNSMLRLFAEKETLSITTDQVGCPTNAYHLANLIHHIVIAKSSAYGTYHFSNRGATTWFAFAQEIQKGSKSSFSCTISPVDAYPTPAKRPANSVLSTSKVTQVFGIEVATWQEALAELQAKDSCYST
jgi:dTDP-4-dehydrorhamnose reductase